LVQTNKKSQKQNIVTTWKHCPIITHKQKHKWGNWKPTFNRTNSSERKKQNKKTFSVYKVKAAIMGQYKPQPDNKCKTPRNTCCDAADTRRNQGAPCPQLPSTRNQTEFRTHNLNGISPPALLTAGNRLENVSTPPT
jgi:hypothetical protein